MSHAEQLETGTVLEPAAFTSVQGERIPFPDPRHLTHLQFRRFAGCPICHTHLRSFAQRHDEIRKAGVREVVFFHTGHNELARHTDHLPFDVIPDPHKRVYRRFGVESGRRSLTRPHAWWGILRSAAPTLIAMSRGKAHLPEKRPEGGRLGLPADFLIAPGGKILASKYGSHADDQWTVDEVLELAEPHRP